MHWSYHYVERMGPVGCSVDEVDGRMAYHNRSETMVVVDMLHPVGGTEMKSHETQS